MLKNSIRVVVIAFLFAALELFVGGGPLLYASAAVSSSDGSNAISGNNNLEAMQGEMLDYVNQARLEAGLSILTLDPLLTYGANLKSSDMAINSYFSHISPTYGSPLDMMNSLGINHNIMGENLAKNFSVKQAFNAFMNSPLHRANLLKAEYTNAGFGFYQTNDYLYVTEWFTG